MHTSRAGGGALIVDKYGAAQGITVALRSTETEFVELMIENESAMQNAKTGAAPSSCVKSGATQTTVKSVLMLGSTSRLGDAQYLGCDGYRLSAFDQSHRLHFELQRVLGPFPRFTHCALLELIFNHQLRSTFFGGKVTTTSTPVFVLEFN